jgi:hypothetical protein
MNHARPRGAAPLAIASSGESATASVVGRSLRGAMREFKNSVIGADSDELPYAGAPRP